MRPATFAPIVGVCLTIGCASQTKLPEHIRVAVSSDNAGRTVELRQSCYYGDLYDENEKYLLSPYAFADTFHIVNTKGDPIHPQGQRGIIKAGTRFVIQKVEFPDMVAMATRMLTTPRYNPWVYLTPAPESVGIPSDRSAYVLLLPMDLLTKAQAEDAIAALVSPIGDVQQWLSERQPTVRVAIEHKDIINGMSVDELVASMGPPQRWFNEAHPQKVAWYTSREAWIVNDEVVDVKPGRHVELRPPKVDNETNDGPAAETPENGDTGAAE